MGRVRNERMERWRLGKELKLSATHNGILENRHSTQEELEKARAVLNQYVVRHIKHAIIISYNAALGIFPSSDKIPGVEYAKSFDLSFLRKVWTSIE